MIMSRPPGTTPARRTIESMALPQGSVPSFQGSACLRSTPQGVGKTVPGEAGGPLQPVQALHEVLGQDSGAIAEGLPATNCCGPPRWGPGEGLIPVVGVFDKEQLMEILHAQNPLHPGSHPTRRGAFPVDQPGQVAAANAELIGQPVLRTVQQGQPLSEGLCLYPYYGAPPPCHCAVAGPGLF